MQTRVKGWRHRREATKYYEDRGYAVAVVERTGRFIKEKDAFGLFDLLAVSKDKVILIQVTSNRPHPHYKLQEFANKYASEHLIIMQLVWIDGDGFKEYYYNGRENI